MAADSPRIGTRIRRARERKRMTQAALAEALGVSRSAINAWENDKSYPQSSVGALEDVLGISLGTTDEEKRQELKELMRRVEELAAELSGGGSEMDEDVHDGTRSPPGRGERAN